MNKSCKPRIRTEKRKWKQLAAGLLAAALFLTQLTPVSASAENVAATGENVTVLTENATPLDGVQVVSQNQTISEDQPELIEFLSEDSVPVDGYIPDNIHIDSIQDGTGDYAMAGELPSAYDSRSVDTEGGLKNYVTSVKNQSTTSLCWAFATAAVAESSLIKKGIFDLNLDLSESHLGYFFYNHVNDPLSGTVGDNTQMLGTGYNYLSRGGNTAFTTFALAGWTGLADEASAPFSTLAGSLPDSIAYSDVAHMKNAFWISNNDRNQIKTQIMANGAVTTNIQFSSIKINSNHAYYLPTASGLNHAITVVGWDDSFDRTLFGDPTTVSGETVCTPNPEENGAWLVKDSYGATNSNNRSAGYFWLSYEDASLALSNNRFISFDFDTADNYDHNYQYDGSYGTNGLSMSGGTLYMANVFTAKANSAEAESLRAISFGTSSVNTDYSIQVYTGLTSTTNPTSGTQMLSQPQTGSLTYAGYHTVDLSTPIYLREGESFSVIVKLVKRSGDSSTAVTGFVDQGYTNGNWIRFTSAVSTGQSFYSSGGTSWSDAANLTIDGAAHPTCMRLKAYTDDCERTETYLLDGDMVADLPDMTYTGAQLRPNPVIYYDGTRLVKDTDYTVIYDANVNNGKKAGKITITGKGTYKTEAPIIRYFNINKRSMLDESILIKGTGDVTYTGLPQKPITLSDTAGTGESKLVEYDPVEKTGSYAIYYSKNINTGQATAVITGRGNYQGSRKVYFNIQRRDITDEGITIQAISDQPYTGSAITPAPVISDSYRGGDNLSLKSDVTVVYKNNVMPGTCTVTLTGKGNYQGTRTITFTVSPRPIASLAVSAIRSQPYAGGKLIEPEVKITDGSTELREGIHYTVLYENNVNVGQAKITILGKSGTIYAGSSKTITFNIYKCNIATNAVLTGISDKSYVNGKTEYTQDIVLTLKNGTVLKEGVDFAAIYTDNKKPTESTPATVTIMGTGDNYDGTIIKSFRIISDKKVIGDRSDTNLTVSYQKEYMYQTFLDETQEFRPIPVITYKGTQLVQGKDYKVDYKNNIYPGTATMTITALSGSGFYGIRTETYTIRGKAIFALDETDVDFTISTPVSKVYTGGEVKQTVKIFERYYRPGRHDAQYALLTEGKSYTVTYENNVDVGTATYTVTGIRYYSGSKTFTFPITKKDIATVKAVAIPNQTYTGTVIRPGIALKNGSEYLVEDTDYTTLLSDNINAGTATIFINAKADSRNYTGSRKITFDIKQKSLSSLLQGTEVGVIEDQYYDGTDKKIAPVLKCGNYILAQGTDYKLSYYNTTGIGKAWVNVTALGKKEGGSGNFSGSRRITYTIRGKQLSVATPLDGYSTPYTGGKIKPLIPTLTETDTGTILYDRKNYTVEYTGNINAGTAYAVIKGKGIYAGSQLQVPFTITPLAVGEYTISMKREIKLGTQTSVRPAVTIRVQGRRLKKGVDYTVTYLNNTKKGTAYVKVAFIGNYTGYGVSGFTIL